MDEAVIYPKRIKRKRSSLQTGPTGLTGLQGKSLIDKDKLKLPQWIYKRAIDNVLWTPCITVSILGGLIEVSYFKNYDSLSKPFRRVFPKWFFSVLFLQFNTKSGIRLRYKGKSK